MSLLKTASLWILFLSSAILHVKCASPYTFSSDFLFGTGTASYQIEGAWNEDGKGENIWDVLTHEQPELITDQSNGDIACDSYHKYEDDVALLVNMGVNYYRFSISWSRIFPNGHPYKLNQKGIDYYNKLIDSLQKNNITVMVTMYHWDLPQKLQVLGGWANPQIVLWYKEYAKVLLDNFGDRVKYWLTFNEPYQICQEGYGLMVKAPLVDLPGRADYLCARHLLKAHAEVYHLFNNTYRGVNDAKMGIAINFQWYHPLNETHENAAERGLHFVGGIYANPIFSTEGDFPKVVKEYVAAQSAKEGYSTSRLPAFTQDEIEEIRGTADFLGLNHYNTLVAVEWPANSTDTSYLNDRQVHLYADPSWPLDDANRTAITPWGFRNILVWLKENYNDPEIHVTENGCPDNPATGLNDNTRISYLGQYLEALLQAVNEDNVKVKSYSLWSLMDNFEWRFGYTYRYGIHSVDFNDQNRPRTAKDSAQFYKNIISSRKVGEYTIP